MKQFRRIGCFLAAAVLSVSMLASAAAENRPLDEAALRQDFYGTVNADWIAGAQVPPEEGSLSAFTELEKKVDRQLNEDFKAMAAGTMEAPNPEMKKMIAMYKKALDFKTRDAEGTAPLKPYLEKIAAIKTMADLEAISKEWTLTGLALPYLLSVSTDLKDSTKNILNLSSARGAFFGDPSVYDEANPMGAQTLAVFRTMVEGMLKMNGYTDESAAETVQKALAFDRQMSLVDEGNQSTQADEYHPHTLEQVEAFSKDISFTKIIEQLTGRKPAQVNVNTPAFFSQFSQIVNQDNLENIKAWMTVMMAKETATLLSEDYRQLTRDFNALTYGMEELENREAGAIFSVTSTFGQVVGDYYGKKYFGEKAKADAEKLVRKLIEIHKSRLLNNTWLSKETIANAVKKLDTMHVNIGYADDYSDQYRAFKVDPAKSFMDIYFDYTRLTKKADFEGLDQPVAKGGWQIAAQSASANYSTSDNSITIAAALLQAPFYDVNRSESENLGGIGMVVGHELTHAFDENGAQFDENGNLNNWWTEKDLEAFHQRTDKLDQQWDGYPYMSGKVDAKLTSQENTADNGGLSVALEAMKSLKNPDYKAFFRAYAEIWRARETDEYAQAMLMYDVHAPKKLRCNLVVRNFDEFYDAFGVKEGDPMYLAPEKRVQVW